MPVWKFYKQIYSLQGESLQYAVMFKKSAKEENIILLNQDFEIEGFTQPLLKKLGISNHYYELLLQLNILIFIPSLVQYSKF